ncbi:metal-dependent hydrolase [Haladaptatus cibarius]|uniref:metal-dependent hydrolase n=1 Tax=Haladaptatus cibarius TaxID=453847 RepID=UPI000679A7E0|nr:metal-dependent hydrolase [Haladaptatus cibarius]
MPSVVVHVAVAGLLATSLLSDHFDNRAAMIVMVAAAIPDLDTLVGLWIPGGHRAVFHTLLLPAGIGLLLFTDKIGGSWIRRRWGAYGVRVAWVSLVALLVAGIGLDLVTNGVNVFYPVHDQFYSVSGKVEVSNQEGVVQTFIEPEARGSTENTHYGTGFDLARGPDPAKEERVFPIVKSGRQLLLGAMSFGIVGFRMWESRNK